MNTEKYLTKAAYMKGLTARNMTPYLEEWGFYNPDQLGTMLDSSFMGIGYNNNYVVRHCADTAAKISNRFPLLRVAAMFHDAAWMLEEGKMRAKEAKEEALDNAWYGMRHFEFSERDRKFVRAVIAVHDYNLISTSKPEQPLKQWRKALMTAGSVSENVTWRDILRFVIADQDGKPNWRRKWLVRPIVKYFREQETLGQIVYTRNDLAVSALDILFACPELDKRYFREVFRHLLNYVALRGYEANNKTELVMEAVAYIRYKQEKGCIADSRIHFEGL